MTVQNDDSIITDESDVHDDDDGLEAAANAFLSPGEDDPKGPSDPEKKAPTADEDAEDAPVAEDDKDETEVDDGPEVEIKIGEETRKVKVADLTRLYGQEASLTQKSQQLADRRTEADMIHARATQALTKMVTKAEEAWAPYAELDFALLANQMDADTYAQVKADAKVAFDNLTFHRSEMKEVSEAAAKVQAETTQRAAVECVKELSDPDKGIKGFGPELYQSMVTYADEAGLPEIRTITSPAALRLIHKAMMFDKSQKTAAVVEAKVQKVVNTPKRVLTPTKSDHEEPSSRRAAINRLAKSGDLDDAAAAFGE